MGPRGAVLALFFPACSGKDAPPTRPDPTDTGTYETAWTWPDCGAVAGTDAVTFTADDGATVAGLDGSLAGPAYTTGLVALDTPGALAAVHEGALLRSADAGCTWTSAAFPSDENWLPIAAPGDRIYTWTRLNGDMVSIAGDSFTPLVGPQDSITGLIADPADADHLRAGSGDCSIYESWDGGQTWDLLNLTPSSTLSAYTVAFDPDDLDRAVCTLAGDGLYITANAGERWDVGRGIAEGEKVNVFTATYSTGGARIWAEGLRLERGDKAIWMSEDGGANFISAIGEDEGIALDIAVPLSTHGSVPDTVFFASSDLLYSYDAATGVVTGNAPVGLEIDALLVSPAPLALIYLGLSATDHDL